MAWRRAGSSVIFADRTSQCIKSNCQRIWGCILAPKSWDSNRDNDNELHFFTITYLSSHILLHALFFSNYLQKTKGPEIIMGPAQDYTESENPSGCRIQAFWHADCLLSWNKTWHQFFFAFYHRHNYHYYSSLPNNAMHLIAIYWQ